MELKILTEQESGFIIACRKATGILVVVLFVVSIGSSRFWDCLKWSGTQQWGGGHPTPTGILLRWFVHSDLSYYPELGFDIFRAQVPDIYTPTSFQRSQRPLYTSAA